MNFYTAFSTVTSSAGLTTYLLLLVSLKFDQVQVTARGHGIGPIPILISVQKIKQIAHDRSRSSEPECG